MNIRCKLVTTGLLATGLYAGMIFTNIAWSYDGDIDYLAPYVTLDQESGKLVTVDPRKDAAAAAKLEQEHNASNPNATASIATSTTATTAATNDTGTASTANTLSAPAPASSEQSSSPAASSRATVIAIGTLVIIGLIVVITRRKADSAIDKSGS